MSNPNDQVRVPDEQRGIPHIQNRSLSHDSFGPPIIGESGNILILCGDIYRDSSDYHDGHDARVTPEESRESTVTRLARISIPHDGYEYPERWSQRAH